MKDTRNIMITGASGFIGGHVTRYFIAQGQQISCFVRESSDLSFLKDLPVRYFFGDIMNLPELKKAFHGMDVIIHLAARVNDWGCYSDFYNTNVEGTLNVLKAATTNKISHVIITGSISSYGEENSYLLKNENSPYQSHYQYAFDKIFPSSMNYYRDTKALMTQKAMDFGIQHKLNLTIIEPAWVYGENEFHTGFYEYLKIVKAGIPFMPGSKTNAFHVIYAPDLAKAYYRAFQSHPPGVVRIIAGNDEPILMNKLYQSFCQAAGLSFPRSIPKSLAYPFAFFLELLYTIIKSQKPPLLTRARVKMFYDNIGYQSLFASTLIGFRAETSINEGIAKTVEWYKQKRYI